MAKTEGDQTIPSEWLDAYRATLGEQRPNLAVLKRVPYRLPPMQEGGKNVTAAQRAQRNRFKIARDDFEGISDADRTRWYAAAPEWGSLLWYYNFFIMSSLVGNADIPEGGAGLIKSIQHKTIVIPAGAGEGQVAITAVDPTKTVVMLFGATAVESSSGESYYGFVVYPYISSVAAELIKAKWSIPAPEGETVPSATVSITVIEYI